MHQGWVICFVYWWFIATSASTVTIAQATSTPDGGTPVTIVGTLIAGFMIMTGLAVWIVKRLLDTTIPKLQESFQSIIESDRKAAQLAAEKQQTIFQIQIDREQSIFREEMKSARDLFARETQALRDMFEKKLTFERELYERQLNIIMEDCKEERESFIRAISALEERNKHP